MGEPSEAQDLLVILLLPVWRQEFWSLSRYPGLVETSCPKLVQSQKNATRTWTDGDRPLTPWERRLSAWSVTEWPRDSEAQQLISPGLRAAFPAPHQPFLPGPQGSVQPEHMTLTKPLEKENNSQISSPVPPI